MPARWFLLTALLAICLLATREWMLMPDGKLHVYFLDVDHGDSTLIVTPKGQQIVVDGGPNVDALEHLGTNMPFFDRTIELLVLTHPDLDHVTAFPEILKRYTVEHVLLTGVQHNQGRYEAFLHELQQQQISVLFPHTKEDIQIEDGIVLDVIWPEDDLLGTEVANSNDASIVFRLIYNEHEILMTGDIGEETENRILASGQDIRSDVLKVPHHGSNTSSSTGFLLAVQPRLAVIPAGNNNRFGHPHADVLYRYETLNIPYRVVGWEQGVSLTFE